MILKKWKKTKTKKDQQIKEILQNPGMGVAGSDNVKIFGWFDIVYRGQPKVTMELQKWPLFPHQMEKLLHSHIAGLHVLNQTLECDHWTEDPFALSARPVNILQEVAHCPVRFAGPFGCEDDVLVESFFTEREYEPEEQCELLNTLWQWNYWDKNYHIILDIQKLLNAILWQRWAGAGRQQAGQ